MCFFDFLLLAFTPLLRWGYKGVQLGQCTYFVYKLCTILSADQTRFTTLLRPVHKISYSVANHFDEDTSCNVLQVLTQDTNTQGK